MQCCQKQHVLKKTNEILEEIINIHTYKQCLGGLDHYFNLLYIFSLSEY